MNLTIDLEGPFEPWSLEQFVAWVEDEVDPEDPESVRAAARPLRCLAENRDLLSRALVQRLETWKDDDPRNVYDQESIVLHYAGKWAVRANVWRPPHDDPDRDQKASLQAPYGHCHNHNFPLLTVGYEGPGYRTRIFRCDPDSIIGYVGEKVELTFVEETTLPRGKVMFYPAYEILHQQSQPDALSISLNLVALADRDPQRNQLHFDVERARIEAIDGRGSAGRNFLRLAFGALGDPRLAEPLERLAKKHHAPEMRDFAWQALAELPGQEAENRWREALDDQAPRVRRLARLALDGRLPPAR